MGFRKLLIALLSLAALPALAQNYPTKPVRLIIAFTPGSSTDIIGRVVAAKLQEMWGQPVVAENRVGAGGTVGSAVVARADADGYTLLANSSAHVANPGIYASMPYDTLKDFANLALLGGGPNVLMVSPAAGWKSLRDFIDVAKASPGKLNFSSAGIGSGTHFNLEKLKITAGIDVTHIPYKGTPEAIAHHRRAGVLLLRADQRRAAAHQGRQGARPRGHERAALEPPARGADDRGSGRAGIRLHALGRAVGPGGDAGELVQQDQRREQGAGDPDLAIGTSTIDECRRQCAVRAKVGHQVSRPPGSAQ
jgi:hypothetical protein